MNARVCFIENFKIGDNTTRNIEKKHCFVTTLFLDNFVLFKFVPIFLKISTFQEIQKNALLFSQPFSYISVDHYRAGRFLNRKSLEALNLMSF